MQPIPLRIRERINESQEFKKCIHSSGCDGRITIEHAWKFAGRQIPNIQSGLSDELFLALLVPCCEVHNIGVSGKEKDWNKYIALMNVIDADLWEEFVAKYPKKDWNLEFSRLADKFNYVNLC